MELNDIAWSSMPDSWAQQPKPRFLGSTAQILGSTAQVSHPTAPAPGSCSSRLLLLTAPAPHGWLIYPLRAHLACTTSRTRLRNLANRLRNLLNSPVNPNIPTPTFRLRCCATFLLRNLFVAQPFCCATSQPQPLGCVVAQPCGCATLLLR